MEETEVEHALLVTALQITLCADESTSRKVTHLKGLAEEVQAEGRAAKLSLADLDRYFMARLIEEPPSPATQEPVPYLLGCFQRASEIHATPTGRSHTSTAGAVAAAVKDHAVSYTWLCFSGEEVVQQDATLEARGAVQLLDAVWVAIPHASPIPAPPTPLTPLPSGFIEQSLIRFPNECAAALTAIFNELRTRTASLSILGDFHAINSCWFRFLESKELQVAVGEAPSALLPTAAADGRAFERASALASLFAVSFLPDDGRRDVPQPPVEAQCLASIDERRPRDVDQMHGTLWTPTRLHASVLCQIFSPKCLLAKETRGITLRWLGTALAVNKGERMKMHMRADRASSNGFMYNLTRVLLNLCAPFMDFYNGKAVKFVDLRYLQGGGLVTYEDEGRLGASPNDVAAWAAEASSSGSNGGEPFHFITECFFLTASCLNLGVSKLIEQLREKARALHQLRGMVEGQPPSHPYVTAVSPLTFSAPESRLPSHFAHRKAKAEMLAIDAALRDDEFASALLSWCQLTAAWLLHAACGQLPNAVTLPLPATPPRAFCCIPEYIVMNLADMLQMLHETGCVRAAAALHMTDVVLCCTALVSSTSYVPNPYARYKLATVLFNWSPASQATQNLRRQHAQGIDMESLFTAHPAVLTGLLPGLLNLYKDVEYTDRGNQFYEKFGMRQEIARLLEWLWQVPQHREAWKSVARAGDGIYLRFLNHLLNDCLFLLDDAMNILPQMKEAEAKIDSPEWESMSQHQRGQHRQQLEEQSQQLRFKITGAAAFVNMLVYTSEQLPEPYVSVEMVKRVAEMLNYFLRHLTGPDRGKLKVSNPAKYNFHPKQLLSDILRVFVYVRSGDNEGRFVAAIVQDGRSYRSENFTEALRIAAEVGLPGIDGGMLSRLEHLSEHVQAAAEAAQHDDEMLADVPPEFLDPITDELMTDPVVLPASGVTIDRSVILRHLMTDARDPINRAPLQPEELRDDVELRDKINAWRENNQRAP